ncbi:MAG: hydantoinase B/oxoprolinase family protein [Chloroflexi bacterium]|nr:MAG: hydantoinase B/oxoprolinase family protein [Chloroflexota bacterium]
MVATHTDPVTTEIIRNAFIAIADDMNAALIRSAYTPVIYEGKDCSVALLDADGNVLGQSAGLPIFLGNLEICVKLTAELFGWDVFKPGDVWLMNDSYMTGTHLHDATIYAPIFWQGERVGFSCTRAHWHDVGGKDPGGSTDSTSIYQEGIRFPPTKIYENGEPRHDIHELIKRNVRFGYGTIGDMNAQVAACRTGEQRVQQLLERFGYETILAARDSIFAQSEVLERETVRHIPDGTYTAEGFLDNDGIRDEPVAVRLRIDVEGEQMTMNLDGSSPTTRGPVNCGFAQTVSACRVAFKMLINPERPVDGGTFKTLHVTAPEGSIFYASEPAACEWYFTPLGLLIDLIVKALAPVMPQQAAGAHYGDSMVIHYAGDDPRHDGRPFLGGEPNPGGWGAYHNGDGQDGLINTVNGGFKDIPVEILETKYPMMLRRYGLRTDTGGPGRFRGGCGVYREYHLEADTVVYLWLERSVTPGWGLFGGGDAVGPDVVINPGTDSEQHLLKANALELGDGDVILLQTGGGGGYGPPHEREVDRVRRDVLDGYVSLDMARQIYGVVLRDDLSVDDAATRQLRESMQ